MYRPKHGAAESDVEWGQKCSVQSMHWLRFDDMDTLDGSTVKAMLVAATKQSILSIIL